MLLKCAKLIFPLLINFLLTLLVSFTAIIYDLFSMQLLPEISELLEKGIKIGKHAH